MNGASKQQGAPVLARTMGWREAAVSHGQRSFARNAPPASNPALRPLFAPHFARRPPDRPANRDHLRCSERPQGSGEERGVTDIRTEELGCEGGGAERGYYG